MSTGSSGETAKHCEDFVAVGKGPYFPVKLYNLLESIDKHPNKEGSDIISWLPGGKSFKVHEKQEFVRTYLPMFSKASKFKSFQRNLNLWSFRTVSKGPHKGVCSHPGFVKGRPDLIKNMIRTSVKGNGVRGGKIPEAMGSSQTNSPSQLSAQQQHQAFPATTQLAANVSKMGVALNSSAALPHVLSQFMPNASRNPGVFDVLGSRVALGLAPDSSQPSNLLTTLLLSQAQEQQRQQQQASRIMEQFKAALIDGAASNNTLRKTNLQGVLGATTTPQQWAALLEGLLSPVSAASSEDLYTQLQQAAIMSLSGTSAIQKDELLRSLLTGSSRVA